MALPVSSWRMVEEVSVYSSDALHGMQIVFSEDAHSATVRLFQLIGDVSLLRKDPRSWVFDKQEKKYGHGVWKITWTALARLQASGEQVDTSYLHPSAHKMVLQVVGWVEGVPKPSHNIWVEILDECKHRVPSIEWNKNICNRAPPSSTTNEVHYDVVSVYFPENVNLEKVGIQIHLLDNVIKISLFKVIGEMFPLDKDKIQRDYDPRVWEISWSAFANLLQNREMVSVDTSLLQPDLYDLIRQTISWLSAHSHSSATQRQGHMGLEVIDQRSRRSPLMLNGASLSEAPRTSAGAIRLGGV